jgi:hypothetical protein
MSLPSLPGSFFSHPATTLHLKCQGLAFRYVRVKFTLDASRNSVRYSELLLRLLQREARERRPEALGVRKCTVCIYMQKEGQNIPALLAEGHKADPPSIH